MSNDLGLDRSGNGNNWTVNNMTLAVDQMLDTPTNNFATLNPLNKEGHTLSEGNLLATCTADWVQVYGTQSIIKNYFESQILSSGSPQDNYFGISTTTKSNNVRLSTDGTLRKDGTTISSNTSFTTGDIIGMAVDVPSGTIQFYKNGSANGNTTISTTDDWVAEYRGANTRRTIWNFGQDSSFAGNKTAQGNQDSNGIGDFYYTPPSGFLALCTSNLPNVAVKPSQHFNTVLYTANNSTNAITGVGFRPDFIWTKSRSNPYSHDLYDAVRGTSRRVQSNRDYAENTLSNTIESFDSDGFTVGASDNGNSTGNSVSWNWRAGTSVSGTTTGSGTGKSYTGSVNADAGFSIISYEGNGTNGHKIYHHLNEAPEMVIIKNRGSVTNFGVYHYKLADTQGIKLNETDGATTENWYQNTDPTSTIVELRGAGTVNENTKGHIAYCFHSVNGYSKVGSYVGNGDTDGTFIYTGFRPAYVMVKPASRTGRWRIKDAARDVYNVMDKRLSAESLDPEFIGYQEYIDFLSNGFKARALEGQWNGNGELNIYIAFAEIPFKYSNAR